MLIVALVLVCFDDAALAGAAYRDALDALRENRYDDAVARLQEAIRLEPRETEKLIYRDREGRHSDPYHPHLVWARARILQARSTPDPAARVKLLREALTHLDLTDPPPAAAALDALKRELAEAEKEALPSSADDAAAAQRRKILTLCDQERFEEALAAADSPSLAGLVESRRRPVLARYEQSMTQALEAAALASPADKPEAIPLILQPALLPPGVAKDPGPRPAWYRDFFSLVSGRLPLLHNLPREEDARVLDCAQAFDDRAAAAAEAAWLPAFRAAAHLADSIRNSRLAALDDGRDDARLDRILSDMERALRRRDSLLATFAAEGRVYREGVLGPSAATVAAARARREARVRLREALRDWTAAAERALSDPAVMGRPAALRAVSQKGAPLRSGPAWAALDSTAKSRALFLGGLLDLVAAILEGGPQADVREPVASVRAARALDAAAGRDWEDRLSPKLRARLAEADR